MSQDSLSCCDTATPVIVLGAEYGGLGVARTLGRAGVSVYGIHPTRSGSLWSRYWRQTFIWDFGGAPVGESVAFLQEVARTVGRRAILVCTNDRAAVFVTRATEALEPWFIFPHQEVGLVQSLLNKRDLCALALGLGIPTAKVIVPRSRDDVVKFGEHAILPVMVKSIDPTGPHGKLKAVASTLQELLTYYPDRGAIESPNLVLQEYIPGSDDSGWTLYGYFDDASECLAGFTAQKIRLAPPSTGVTSLGIVDENESVQTFCRRFMKGVGYRGAVNIGGKRDHRDGLYKVLDVNVRVGASFRLCVGEGNLDVARILYLHLTGQRLPIVRPSVGRKWLLEEDVFSSLAALRKGELSFGQWLQSVRGVQEMARWALGDPLPFALWTLARVWSVVS